MITSRQYRINISDICKIFVWRENFHFSFVFCSSILNLSRHPFFAFSKKSLLYLISFAMSPRNSENCVYTSNASSFLQEGFTVSLLMLRTLSLGVNATWVYFSISSTHLLLFRVWCLFVQVFAFAFAAVVHLSPRADFRLLSSSPPHRIIKAVVGVVAEQRGMSLNDDSYFPIRNNISHFEQTKLTYMMMTIWDEMKWTASNGKFSLPVRFACVLFSSVLDCCCFFFLCLSRHIFIRTTRVSVLSLSLCSGCGSGRSKKERKKRVIKTLIPPSISVLAWSEETK